MQYCTKFINSKKPNVILNPNTWGKFFAWQKVNGSAFAACKEIVGDEGRRIRGFQQGSTGFGGVVG